MSEKETKLIIIILKMTRLTTKTINCSFSETSYYSYRISSF